MDLELYNFDLPNSLIATEPVTPRDSARLLVVDKKEDVVFDVKFRDLFQFLRPGDFLVFNKTKVIPARFRGQIKGRSVEILLVRPFDEWSWEVLAKPGKKIIENDVMFFSDKLSARVVKKNESGSLKILFITKEETPLKDLLDEAGEMPLPPYILKQRGERCGRKSDREDYQTVYAESSGSIAAPTAGLHFTRRLLADLKKKGINIAFVDLKIGLGTFAPIRVKNIEDHQMHTEQFELTPLLARKLNQAKRDGQRIIAVGTTTVRVLETCQEDGFLVPGKGETSIFIHPGYKFGFVDGLITNFHLPKSSLLLLVSAFHNRQKIMKIYREAIEKNYRFYSYGDGMFLF